MRGTSMLRRLLLQRRVSNLGSATLIETLISSPKTIIPPKPLSHNFASTSSTDKFTSSKPFLHFQRSFCSSPDSKSNIVLIKSEEDFNSSLSKVQDESLPAIYYFTAVWCGPCRFISPVIGELSVKYPHVKTYKIDIDQEGLGNTLSKLNITSVPTLHFFQNGKKAAEVIGADIARLKNTMEELYN